MYARSAPLSILLPLLAAGLCLSVAVRLRHRRDELGAPWLLTLIGSVAILNVGAAIGSLLVGSDILLELSRFSAVMEVTAGLACLGFAVGYSGLAGGSQRGSWMLSLALFTVGLGVAGGLTGTDVLVAGVTPVGEATEPGLWVAGPGPAAGLAQWVVWSGVGLATLIILTHLAQSPGHWAQRVAVVAAPALLGVGGAMTGIGQGAVWFVADPVPVAAALAVSFVGHVLIGDQPAGSEPVARSAVVEEMEDPVVVLGRDGRIVDLNRASRQQLGLEVRGPLPFEVATLWAESWEARSRGVALPRSRVELDCVYGTRAVFELTMTPLGPRAGRNRTVLVLRDITERERMEAQLMRATESLRFLANTDGLTGLANRRYFEERLHEEVERAQRYERPMALVVLDLDHFKTVNDTWGHPAGDRVLQGTATSIESVLREMDLAGRLGGEELAVLLPETDEDGAEALAERLRRKIKEKVHHSDDGQPFHVTASLGVTYLAAGEVQGADALLTVADRALYQAKLGGRDRVVTKRIGSRVDRSA